MSQVTRISALAAIAFAISGGVANADQIDGTWCSPTGQSMTIQGPQAIIPSGKRIEGNYDRHNFDYVVPAGDLDAGTQIIANQINDNTIRVANSGQTQQNPDAHEIWTRCDVTS